MQANDLLGDGWCRKRLQQSLDRGMFYVWADSVPCCVPRRRRASPRALRQAFSTCARRCRGRRVPRPGAEFRGEHECTLRAVPTFSAQDPFRLPHQRISRCSPGDGKNTATPLQ